MKEITLLPADIYTVINKSVLSSLDQSLLIDLYTPIIGSLPIALYLSFWKDLNKYEIMSIDFTHHHLMTILKSSLDDIKQAKEALEAIGLLKTYVKESDINSYVYELYSPLPAFEFFNHPIFNVVLYNNIGKKEYDNLRKVYSEIKFDLKEYQDISKKFDETFASVPPQIIETNNEIKEAKKGEISYLKGLDFDLITSGMPKGIINERTFNKKAKELINNLAFVYDLDSFKMIEILRTVINEHGFIDKENLRKSARNYYQFNNNGTLPTLIYRSQPEYLKSPSGDATKRGRILYVFENTSPYDFLKSKYKGGIPALRDKKLLETLVVDLKLKPAVVNVLIDYVLKINNNKLNSAYVETIAGQWKRLGVETAADAMAVAEKEHKKVNKKISNNENVKTPVWFDENIEKEETTEEEKKEMEALLKEFK